jgi:hypothetical protein
VSARWPAGRRGTRQHAGACRSQQQQQQYQLGGVSFRCESFAAICSHLSCAASMV